MAPVSTVAVLGAWHVHARDYARAALAHPDTSLVAVWDHDESLGRPLADELGVAFTDDLDVLLAREDVDAVTVTTDDGSYGRRGTVADVLPDEIERTGASAVYACGPMPMLRAVGAVAASYGLPCQVAVEESMACGIGVCMTCVLPVRGADGSTRMVRSCVEGPVFLGDRVRWDAIGTVPPDALGAPPLTPTTGGT